jgi:RNA polymerase sigma-70 factor (sigma-E family)
MPTPDEDFEEFVRGKGLGLLRLATLLTGDPGAGEDLLQSVLAAMYGRWAKGRPPDAPDAYARKALAHGAQRLWRRRRTHLETLVAEPPDTPQSGPFSDPALRHVLLAALRQLPARQRAVVALRYFDDYREAEVAELLGCRIGTVKSHAHRGLQRLRSDPALAAYLDPVTEV